MSSPTTLLPFQPLAMSPAQLAAVSYLARYSGRTHALYAFQLRRWFSWCESNGLDPLIGIQRAHVELYIRQLGESGLMDSSVVTMMHGIRGFFRYAHIDGTTRLPKIHRDECRTQGLARDRARLAGPGDLPRRTHLGPLILRPLTGKPVDRRDVYRMVQRIARAAGIPRHQPALAAARRDHQRPRRRRPTARRPDPRPPRRPTDHRALRPRPRKPRPPRRPLPHRLRRRRLTVRSSA
jgi:hypothetical protein